MAPSPAAGLSPGRFPAPAGDRVSFTEVAGIADLVARALALGLVALTGVVWLTHWGVRKRHIGAFNPWSKTVRHLSDPMLRPIERQLVRRGGNPQEATVWLLGLSVVAGLILVSMVRWLFGMAYAAIALSQATSRVWAQVAVSWVIGLVMLAIFVRYLVTWFGVPPTAPWLRPFRWLTDWIIVPIRRILPPFGMIDASPIAAYFALYLLRALIMSVFFRA